MHARILQSTYTVMGEKMKDPIFTILVVDDSETNRKYFRFILEEDGYHVVEAESGERALDLLGVEKPLLVLLDVVMGGIDGFETLRRMREDPSGIRTPVIMLTSLDDQKSKLKAFELGAVDYIVKSANPAEVRARVKVHVRLSLSSRQLVASHAESIGKLSAAQRSFLTRPDDVPGAGFSVYYRSLFEAGGDFYEVMPVGEDVHFYLIADVAGHDIGTSYVTPAVKVLLKQFATPMYSLEETFQYMNGVLTQTLCVDTYLTAFALRLNRRASKAVFLSAGHPPAAYIPVEGPCRFLDAKGPFVGMVEELAYKSESMDVVTGDRFVLFTDGLVEGSGDASVSGWQLAKEKLLPVLEELRGAALDQLPSAIVSGMKAGDADDDVAVLAIEV